MDGPMAESTIAGGDSMMLVVIVLGTRRVIRQGGEDGDRSPL